MARCVIDCTNHDDDKQDGRIKGIPRNQQSDARRPPPGDRSDIGTTAETHLVK